MQNKNSNEKKRPEHKKPPLIRIPFKEIRNIKLNSLKIQKSNFLSSFTKYKNTFKNENHQRKSFLSFLPLDIIHTIMLYLPSKDIIQSFQLVDKSLLDVCSKKSIWVRLSKNRDLKVWEKYKIQKLICERRSKGMIFKAESRLSDEIVQKYNTFFEFNKVLIKKINLAELNGGNEDGVPASLLREINYSSILDHENLMKYQFFILINFLE